MVSKKVNEELLQSRHFHFTDHMFQICKDMTQRVPALSHINMDKVAVGFCSARNYNSPYGTYATLTPLRFENGATVTVRDGRKYTLQKVIDRQNSEKLYLLNFYLPRFFIGSFIDRLTTTVHELWHISPEFNGDIRRLGGRCYVHSGSQKDFDAVAQSLAKQWLTLNPDPQLYEFLKLDLDQIVQQYGPLIGSRYSPPKLIPVKE